MIPGYLWPSWKNKFPYALNYSDISSLKAEILYLFGIYRSCCLMCVAQWLSFACTFYVDQLNRLTHSSPLQWLSLKQDEAGTLKTKNVIASFALFFLNQFLSWRMGASFIQLCTNLSGLDILAQMLGIWLCSKTRLKHCEAFIVAVICPAEPLHNCHHLVISLQPEGSLSSLSFSPGRRGSLFTQSQ